MGIFLLISICNCQPRPVLMDIVMPGKVDGTSVAEIITTELDIPVIFLTAFAEDQIIDRVKRSVINLLKPGT